MVHLEVLQHLVLLHQLRRHLLHLPLHVLLQQLLMLLQLLHRLGIGLRRRSLQAGIVVPAAVEFPRDGGRLLRYGVRSFQAEVAQVVAQV
eukprot:scaffold6286_cov106-Isochrysis_galbana.AAC.4